MTRVISSPSSSAMAPLTTIFPPAGALNCRVASSDRREHADAFLRPVTGPPTAVAAVSVLRGRDAFGDRVAACNARRATRRIAGARRKHSESG
jgi:hypothetical protein